MNNSSLFKEIFELVSRYVDEISDPKTPAVEYLKPEQLLKKLNPNLPKREGKVEDVLEEARKYLRYSVRTGSRQYFNQLWGGFSLPGFLGDVIASLSNTSMYTYEVAPVATLMERELVMRMCSMAGFEKGEGLFVTGASNANLVAVLNARNRAQPKIKSEGYLACGKELRLFISDQAHYSFLKAANISGLGQASVVKIKSDSDGKMIPAELEKAIAEEKRKGNLPFFVAATAGTTVLGAFDPVERIADIAEKHGLWLHVDGALGGSVLMSSKHAELLKGIERADSLGWNAHKMLSMPIVCSVILMKEKGLLLNTAASRDTEEQYLFHQNETSDYDLGPMSLQCGRRVDALKLWLAWTYYGEDGFEKKIDRLFELAEYAEKSVKAESRLELAAPRQSVSICFRYIPESGANIDEFNTALREKLHNSGKSLVNYATVDGKIAIRLVILNSDLETTDIDRFFENLLSVAQS